MIHNHEVESSSLSPATNKTEKTLIINVFSVLFFDIWRYFGGMLFPMLLFNALYILQRI